MDCLQLDNGMEESMKVVTQIYFSDGKFSVTDPNFQNNCLNFMNWKLNSLTKDNFHRVVLIEAHNSIFNYDLISVCETNLDDSVELPETLLKDYTFEPIIHLLNIKRGGVGIFYKNSLPVNIRHDLSFDESIS